MTAQAVSAADRHTLTCSYPGQRRQIRLVRAAVAVLLDDCPVAAEAILVASELAANAVVHSNSAAPGGRFTVHAEVCPGHYVRIEVRDQGGKWAPRDYENDRPHGLDLIDALAGTGNWGITGDAEHGRVAWALLDWLARDLIPLTAHPGMRATAARTRRPDEAGAVAGAGTPGAQCSASTSPGGSMISSPSSSVRISSGLWLCSVPAAYLRARIAPLEPTDRTR